MTVSCQSRVSGASACCSTVCTIPAGAAACARAVEAMGRDGSACSRPLPWYLQMARCTSHPYGLCCVNVRFGGCHPPVWASCHGSPANLDSPEHPVRLVTAEQKAPGPRNAHSLAIRHCNRTHRTAGNSQGTMPRPTLLAAACLMAALASGVKQGSGWRMRTRHPPLAHSNHVSFLFLVCLSAPVH